MGGITTISIPLMTCIISGFEFHWTIMGISQMALERIYDTFKRYPRIVGVYVFSVYQFQWTWLHGALWEHATKKLTLCWREGSTRPNIEDFFRRLEQNWVYVYSFSFGFATYFLIIIVMWKFTYICAIVCNIISNFQIWKKLVNCLWLSVEDKFVQSVFNIVC